MTLGIHIFIDNSVKISKTAFLPWGPVNTLAFPEFIRIADTFFFFIIDLFHLIGSPGVFDFVKLPKICPGFSNLTRTRSCFLFFFNPQFIDETLIPLNKLRFLFFLGAKGDFFFHKRYKYKISIYLSSKLL